MERQRQVVAERQAARDRARAAQKLPQNQKTPERTEKYAGKLRDAELSVAHNLEKLRNATEHVDYIHEKVEAARQRARLAEAHRDACVGGDDDLPVGRRRRGPAGWGVLLYRFMVGAETTVIVVLLWVAAAGRAPAVGCRSGHVRISI